MRNEAHKLVQLFLYTLSAYRAVCSIYTAQSWILHTLLYQVGSDSLSLSLLDPALKWPSAPSFTLLMIRIRTHQNSILPFASLKLTKWKHLVLFHLLRWYNDSKILKKKTTNNKPFLWLNEYSIKQIRTILYDFSVSS